MQKRQNGTDYNGTKKYLTQYVEMSSPLSESSIYEEQSASSNQHEGKRQANQQYGYPQLQRQYKIKNKYGQSIDENRQTYQRKRQSILESSSKISIQQELPQLLHRLVQLAKELCLTHSTLEELEDQLEPIIQEIVQINLGEYCDEGCSYEFENQHSNIRKGKLKVEDNSEFHNGFSSNIFVSDEDLSFQESEASKFNHQKCKNMSIYYNDKDSEFQKPAHQGNHAQIQLVTNSQKELIQIFFKRYVRIIQNSLLKISKYEGQKKLKFLVETVIKQIFTETMRVSYDLKIIQHQAQKQSESLFFYNRKIHAKMIFSKISTVLIKRGSLSSSFRMLKKVYHKQQAKDRAVITKLVQKIQTLNQIFVRKRRFLLTKSIFEWRSEAFALNWKGQMLVFESVRETVKDILANLSQIQSIESLSYNSANNSMWRQILSYHLNLVIKKVSGSSSCIYVDLEGIMHEKFNRLDNHESMAQFLNEKITCESLNSNRTESITDNLNSYRHSLPENNINSILHEFYVNELRECLLNGSIYRCEKSIGSLLLIPLKSISGMVLVALNNCTQSFRQSQYSQQAQESEKTVSFGVTKQRQLPMNINGFRMILKVIEEINPTIAEISHLCKRVDYFESQVQAQSYYSNLFQEYLKSDTLLNPSECDHIQNKRRSSLMMSSESIEIQNKDGLQMEIKTSRMNTHNEAIMSIFLQFSIKTMMVYHCSSNSQSCSQSYSKQLNEMPCIVYGDQSMAHKNRPIIQAIFNQLLHCKKDVLAINKDSICSYVLPLTNHNAVVGLLHYYLHTQSQTMQVDRQVDNQMITKCLLPLILKSEGNLQCNLCHVQVSVVQMPSIPDKEDKVQLSLNDKLSLMSCQNVEEIERKVEDILKQNLRFQPIFAKMFYRISSSDKGSSHWYLSHSSEPASLQIMKNQKDSTCKQDQKERICKKQKANKYWSESQNRDYVVQTYESTEDEEQYLKILMRNPLFPNAQLHIYQCENSYSFKTIRIPIRIATHSQNNSVSRQRIGELVLGYYHQDQDICQKYNLFLNSMASTIEMNRSFLITNLNSIPNFQRSQLPQENSSFQIMPSLNQNNQTLKRTCQRLYHNIQSISIQKSIKQGQFKIDMYPAMIIFKQNNANNKLIRIFGSISEFLENPINFSCNFLSTFFKNHQIKTEQSEFIVSSHEHVFASSRCSMKNNQINQRPARGEHFKEVEVVLPILEDKLNLNIFLKEVEEKYLVKAWIKRDDAEELHRICKMLCCKSENILCFEQSVINLVYLNDCQQEKSSQSWSYFALLINQKSQKLGFNSTQVFSQNNLNTIQSILSAKINQIQRQRYFSSNCQQRINKIIFVEKLLTTRKKMQIRCAVLNFSRLFEIKRKALCILVQTLNLHVISSQNRRSLRVYQCLHEVFLKFIKESGKKKERYERGMPRLLNALNKIYLNLHSGSLLNALKSQTLSQNVKEVEFQRSFHFDQIRSARKIANLIKKALHHQLSPIYLEICILSKVKAQNQVISKQRSIMKIKNWITSKIKRSCFLPFFRQVKALGIELIQNIKCISSEFQNMEFKNRFSFLQYLNVRFNAIVKLKQWSYITSMEILLVKINKSSEKPVIVYKLENDGSMMLTYQTANAQAYDDLVTGNKYMNNTVVQVQPLQSQPFSVEKHLILYKMFCKARSDSSATGQESEQQKCLFKIMANEVSNCYVRYLNDSFVKAQYLQSILVTIFNQEYNSGRVSGLKNKIIYNLNHNFSIDDQSEKVRVFSKLKALSWAANIRCLKSLKENINLQNNNYYMLQYEYLIYDQAILGTLKSLPDDGMDVDYSESKFPALKDVVLKEQIQHIKQHIDILEIDQQTKILQFQLKSKTASSNRILRFFQKKNSSDLLDTRDKIMAQMQYPHEKEDQNQTQQALLVNKKLNISKLKQSVREMAEKQRCKYIEVSTFLIGKLIKSFHNKSMKSLFFKLHAYSHLKNSYKTYRS